MNKLADEEQTIPNPGIISYKQIIAAVIFFAFALYLATVVPTIEIAWVSAILVLTIYLFVFEVVGVDVAAITVMVLLGLTTLLAPVMGLQQGLVDNKHLFDGFSSNAVMSIIAVMIIGAGLDKTGIMSKVAAFILRTGGATEKRIIPIISVSVGFISSFMQNVGAAALFYTGRLQNFCALRITHVTTSYAYGFYRYSRWHHNHGGFQPPDSAE